MHELVTNHFEPQITLFIHAYYNKTWQVHAIGSLTFMDVAITSIVRAENIPNVRSVGRKFGGIYPHSINRPSQTTPISVSHMEFPITLVRNAPWSPVTRNVQRIATVSPLRTRRPAYRPVCMIPTRSARISRQSSEIVDENENGSHIKTRSKPRPGNC